MQLLRERRAPRPGPGPGRQASSARRPPARSSGRPSPSRGRALRARPAASLSLRPGCRGPGWSGSGWPGPADQAGWDRRQGHRSGSGSASQERSSRSKRLGQLLVREVAGPVDAAASGRAPRRALPEPRAALGSTQRVQRAVQVQGGRLDRRAHRPRRTAARPAGAGSAGTSGGTPARSGPPTGMRIAVAVAPLGLRVRPAGTGPGAEHPPDPLRAVAQQLPLGQQRQLEPERVAAAAALTERVGQHGRAQPQRMRHRDDGQPPHDLGEVRGHRPGDQAAPVVPDHDGVRLAQRPDQAGRVGGGGDEVVAARRLVAAAVSAQVGGDGAVAGLAQRAKLLPPGPPELAGSRAAAAPAARRRSRRCETACRWR